MATWQGPDFLDAFKARLAARAGLAGVQIATGYLGEQTQAENISLVSIEGTQDHAALGRERKDDAFTVNGLIWIRKAAVGEDGIKAARDRAADLLSEVETDLKAWAPATVNGNQITRLNLTNIRLQQGANESGRWAQLDFAIQVTVRI